MELMPINRRDRHFRNAARFAGKTYMSWRSKVPSTFVGTSDEFEVNANEFRGMVDSAVRIARNFNGNVKECGLRC